MSEIITRKDRVLVDPLLAEAESVCLAAGWGDRFLYADLIVRAFSAGKRAGIREAAFALLGITEEGMGN